MPKPELSEEQKQIKRLRLWCRRLASDWNFTLRGFIFSILFTTFMAVFLLFLKLLIKPHKEVLASIFVVSICASFLFASPIFCFLRQRFLRQISDQEKICLEEIAQKGNDESLGAKQILMELSCRVVLPEKELLRASKPLDGNTLLRPTVGNEETPKEELLRASEENS